MSPIGDFGGVFADIPAHEFGPVAARAALARERVAPGDVDEVVMGCIGQVGADAYNRWFRPAADSPVDSGRSARPS
ncbi:hypothetical protein U5640_42075 [Streptomyces sp. SS7]|uniref:thiolase family protein n=1 Tax=Streptomyces sp. SS7 TaxID=3108485 RepID=UPI0030EDFB71